MSHAFRSTGPVAQWIRHRPTEPGIAGSSPAGVILSTEDAGKATEKAKEPRASQRRRKQGGRRYGDDHGPLLAPESVERSMSPLWGSNPRPYAYEAHALPTELRRPMAKGRPWGFTVVTRDYADDLRRGGQHQRGGRRQRGGA